MNKLLEIQPKRIAIFRALQLGDLLCAIPAIRALKKEFPKSEITLIGLPWSETFVKIFSNYFTSHIEFPGYPGLPEQKYFYKKIARFQKKMVQENFDLLIQMHGNGSVINPLMELLGAKITAGYYEQGTACPNKNLYMPYPDDLPEVDRHLELVKFLGIPLDGSNLELPISKVEELKFMQLCKTSGLKPKEYVCVHPGGRDENRRWSSEKFARVADEIADNGYTILLTGTETEKETVNRVENLMKHPAINCAGKTDLGTLAVLIKNAQMVFSNDTGVSHIAAAMQTPSVIVFLASDPTRWAPHDKKLHQVILPQYSTHIDLILKKTKKALLYDREKEMKNTEASIDR